MKKNLLILGFALIILAFGSLSFAGDTCTIRVSCSIPAVPGINAPPEAFDENIANADTTEEEVVQEDWEEEEKLLLTRIVKSDNKIFYNIYSR